MKRVFNQQSYIEPLIKREWLNFYDKYIVEGDNHFVIKGKRKIEMIRVVENEGLTMGQDKNGIFYLLNYEEKKEN